MLKGRHLFRDFIALFMLLFLIQFYADYQSTPMKNRTPERHAHHVASKIANDVGSFLFWKGRAAKKKIQSALPEYPLEEGSTVTLIIAQLSSALEYLKQDIDASLNDYSKLMAEIRGTESYLLHINNHYGPQDDEDQSPRRREFNRKVLKGAQRASAVLTEIVNELRVQDKVCPKFESVQDAIEYNEALLKELA